MKKLKRDEARRLFARITAALLVFILVFAFITPFVRGEEISEAGIQVEAVSEGTYLQPRIISFQVKLTNLGQPIKGEAQLRLETSSPNYVIYKQTYANPIELGQGESKELTFTINIPEMQQKYTIALVNEKGKDVYSKVFPIPLIPYTTVNDKEITLSTWRDSDNYYLSSLTSNLPPPQEEVLTALWGIVVIYALSILLMYPILKKLDKREKGFIVIPAAAIGLTLVLYLASFGTEYRTPIINTISIIDVENSNSQAMAQSAIGLFSPKKSTLSVSLNKNINFFPWDSNNLYNGYGNYDQITEPDKKTRFLEKNLHKITYGEEKNTIDFYDYITWATKNILFNTPVDMKGALDTRLEINGDRIIGEIKNNTPYDLEDIVIVAGISFAKYDSIKKGETLAVNHKIEPITLDQSGSYMAINNLFNFDVAIKSKGLSLNEKRLMGLKRTAFENSFNRDYQLISSSAMSMAYNNRFEINFGMTDNLTARVYAFSSQELFDSGITVNGKEPKKHNFNLFRLSVPVEINRLKEISLPYGFITVSQIYSDLRFDSSYMNSLYTGAPGDYFFVVKLMPGINYSALQVNRDFVVEKGVLDAGAAAYEIFDVTANTFVPLLRHEYTDNVNRFINSNNEILIKASTPQEGVVIAIPQISVRGR